MNAAAEATARARFRKILKRRLPNRFAFEKLESGHSV
jgi:hypothetical protein